MFRYLCLFDHYIIRIREIGANFFHSSRDLSLREEEEMCASIWHLERDTHVRFMHGSR